MIFFVASHATWSFCLHAHRGAYSPTYIPALTIRIQLGLHEKAFSKSSRHYVLCLIVFGSDWKQEHFRRLVGAESSTSGAAPETIWQPCRHSDGNVLGAKSAKQRCRSHAASFRRRRCTMGH